MYWDYVLSDWKYVIFVNTIYARQIFKHCLSTLATHYMSMLIPKDYFGWLNNLWLLIFFFCSRYSQNITLSCTTSKSSAHIVTWFYVFFFQCLNLEKRSYTFRFNYRYAQNMLATSTEHTLISFDDMIRIITTADIKSRVVGGMRQNLYFLLD